MKINRWIMFIAILIILGAVATAYFIFSDKELVTVDDKIIVGLSFDSLVVERWKRDMETFVSYANENNMEVIVQVANEDVNEQIKQIQYLIDENVDILVVLPKDINMLNGVVERAQKKGIKVISYDRLMLNSNIDLYISFDNIGIGEAIATTVIEKMVSEEKDEYNLVIINGNPQDYNSKMLNTGYYNVIDKRLEKINIINEVWAIDWREQFSQEAINDLLKNDVRIDGIIASNDMLAEAAIKVLIEYKLESIIPVASQDAELSACQRIAEGTQLATIYKPINDLALQTVELIPKILKSISLEDIDYIDNNKNMVAYKKLPFSIVTKDNLDQIIIDSGFHLREDVYRYVNQ
ncbi:MAG: substrate-binding domain-containing protein [Clostridiales bacterium]|nr:substrate-binding domain-containing protein [Clostridiales bacterium]